MSNNVAQERRIKCRMCAMAGKKSVVYPMYNQTGVGAIFYDEEGRLHNHSEQESAVTYRCQYDHEWSDSETPVCWCGWTLAK